MPMYNLIEYSNNYLKTSRILQQYYRDQPDAATINSKYFKGKNKITGKSPADGDVEIKLSLKYLSNS